MTPKRFNRLLGSGFFADLCDVNANLGDRAAFRAALKLGVVMEVGAYRGVPCLGERDSGRDLDLDWFDGDWCAHCRFLVVRKLSSAA